MSEHLQYSERHQRRSEVRNLTDSLMSRSKEIARLSRDQYIADGLDIHERPAYSGFRFIGSRQATDLFGFAALDLRSKDIPDQLFRTLVEREMSGEELDDALASAPAFVLELYGYSKPLSVVGDRLFMYFCPDSPPAVVYAADLEYVRGKPVAVTDLEINDTIAIQQAFGPNAVHYLDDPECMALDAVVNNYKLEINH